MKRSFKTTRLASFLRSQRWFTLYFGIGIPPALFGAMAVAFRLGWAWGIVINLLIIAWWLETLFVACSRCQFYGTAKCGAQGLVAARLVRRRHPLSIGRRKVQVHLALDIAVIVVVNATWFVAFFPVWPLIAINTVGGWLTVWRRKRFHGLLHRLRPDRPAAGPAATPVELMPLRRRNQAAVDAARAAA